MWTRTSFVPTILLLLGLLTVNGFAPTASKNAQSLSQLSSTPVPQADSSPQAGVVPPTDVVIPTDAAPQADTAIPTDTAPQTDAAPKAEPEQPADMPTSYAQCGRCQSAYTLKESDLGANGKGRRLACSTCGHSWFQSKDRLMTLNDDFEMVPLPQRDVDRIAGNLKEGRDPKYTGDAKLYVGNISFGSSEQDLIELFSEHGTVGEVVLVRDELGRNRGFGFITMLTKEQGNAAMEKLNGAELKGRNLAVRESNS